MMYDELIKDLRESAPKALAEADFDFVEGWLKEAADAIEQLSKPKWIPVTERLPVKGEWVLTYSKYVKPMTDFIDKHGVGIGLRLSPIGCRYQSRRRRNEHGNYAWELNIEAD